MACYDEITDKQNIENGADFTFVCSKIPFAISCSTDLPHKQFNYIDLDLVTKMKIPLRNIRVSKMSLHGQSLRCVGVISQTIQCVQAGKISGTIHLYAKVIRDLSSNLDVDCLASRKTYLRLMGDNPPNEPPDNIPSSSEILVLWGDDDDLDTDDNREDVTTADDNREDVTIAEDNREDVTIAEDNHEDVTTVDDNREDATTADDNFEDVTTAVNDHEDVLRSHPNGSEGWQDCYDSDGNFDPVLTDYINNADDYPDDVYYQAGRLHRIQKKASPEVIPTRRTRENHCEFCFLSGQPIKVTVSHNDLEIQCPSMSDVYRRRIHGDTETDRWLARIHGYHD